MELMEQPADGRRGLQHRLERGSDHPRPGGAGQAADPVVFRNPQNSLHEAYEAGFEDMLRRVPDISKIHKFIGFRPTLRLEEIVEQVIMYYWSSPRPAVSLPSQKPVHALAPSLR